MKRGRTRQGYKPLGRLSYFGAGPIPDRLTCNMVYIQSFRLDTAGSGLPASKAFRGNSLFDPNAAVGVGQLNPLYYDQIMPLYHHSFVHSSRIVVKFANIAGSTQTAAIICVLPSRQSSTSTVLMGSLQQPRAKYRVLPANGSEMGRIVSRATTKAMLPFKNNNLLATITSSPNDQWYWHVTTEGVAQTECVIDCTVEIYYTVTFYERTVQQLST